MKRLRRLLLFALLLAALPLWAADDILSPWHVAKIRSVSAAAISPDGAHVAYILRVPRHPFVEEDGADWAELYVVNQAGESRAYVGGAVNVSEIAWTPDGQGISFLAKRGGDRFRSIHMIPVGGGEAHRVAAAGADITAYAWSPDGRQLVFLAAEPVPESKEKLKKAGFSQEIYEEELRPVRVWVLDATSPEAKPRALELPGSAVAVKWSPEGNKLAVSLTPTPLVDDTFMRQKVHVVDAATGRVLTRIESPGKLGPFAWSPDGQTLAIISAADINDPAAGRLMVAAATGGPLTDLLPGFLGHVTAIAWQDAETVMFVAAEGVWTSFGKVRRDATQRKTIVPVGGAILSGITLSKDGLSGAFLGQTPSHPAEVFAMKHGDTSPRRLTDSNPWLAGMRLAPQEVVRYKAGDGLEIDGLLIRPLDAQPGRRYPLILTVHGGPEAHFSNGWLTSYSNPGQVAAARGFAVFYPNYRASTGRGVAFSKLDHGDPAGKEFQDLLDGVDYLIAQGLADRERVGVTGGSYGGYATAWCSTFYTVRFAAGVMFVGISDLVSKEGTTDIPDENYYVHYLKRAWEDWALLRERSPVTHAPGARTPLLILGGKDDPRVHPSQSLELYRYLKLGGKAPVRLVQYPGEGHGNQRAASKLDYNLRMLQWMEHYLKGPGGAPPAAEVSYEQPK
jgi:dipeptidyl aminopeptidase/acylaminoacyl peptidase